MKLLDIIRLAGRSLRQAKARTVLTSLAIGVGAFTITLSLAAGEGGRDYTDEIVRANTNEKEIVVTKQQPADQTGPQKYSPSYIGSQDAAGGVAGAAQNLSFVNEDDITTIKAIDGVESVAPNYSPSVAYITREGQEKFVVQSLSTFSPSVALAYAAGNVTSDLNNDEIVLTEEYVSALGFESAEQAIGTTVTLHAIKSASATTTFEARDVVFRVAAVSSKSGFAFRAQSSLLISNSAAEQLYQYINEGTRGYNNFILVSVLIDDANNANTVKTALQEKGFDAQTSEDILGTVNTFINVLQAILIGFGALAVLTSVFGIINTQYISVLERTQQIGLMKALGARRRDIGRLFKLEAAWIGFLGGAIGAGLAILAGTIANPLLDESLSLGGVYLLQFTPLAVAGVIVGLIIVAIGAGILPARKAAKLDPIEALRTE